MQRKMSVSSGHVFESKPGVLTCKRRVVVSV